MTVASLLISRMNHNRTIALIVHSYRRLLVSELIHPGFIFSTINPLCAVKLPRNVSSSVVF